jgi:hypothetical protein
MLASVGAAAGPFLYTLLATLCDSRQPPDSGCACQEEEQRQRECEAQRQHYAEHFTNMEMQLESRYDTETVVTVMTTDDAIPQPQNKMLPSSSHCLCE